MKGLYGFDDALTPLAHRAAVTAADLIAAPGTVTCTKQAGGSCVADTYNVKVVAVNAYGRTTATAGDAAVTTETTNLTVRAAFAAVTGATHYDIYCSTDADPKWVGRITEAERASGIKIDAVGSTATGGAAGAVDVEVPGTGLQAATTAAVNTAYSLPSETVDCARMRYCDFDLQLTFTGDSETPALVVVPFLYNSRTQTYRALTPQTITIGGAATNYQPYRQRLRVEVRANSAAMLVVAAIAGRGASLDVDYVLT